MQVVLIISIILLLFIVTKILSDGRVLWLQASLETTNSQLAFLAGLGVTPFHFFKPFSLAQRESLSF